MNIAPHESTITDRHNTNIGRHESTRTDRHNKNMNTQNSERNDVTGATLVQKWHKHRFISGYI